MTPAERVLDALGDGFQAAAGPGLVPLVEAYAEPLNTTDALVTPTPRGWAAAFDLDTTPDPRWLGALAGSRPPGGATTEQAREFIRDRASWRRGTPAAMRAAVAALLTGARRVVLLERDGSPWRLTVRVFTPEVPPGVTAADIKRAALTQKPVGIVLTVEIVAGASYDHMQEQHGPTYAAQAASFPTYAQAMNHLPEEGTTP